MEKKKIDREVFKKLINILEIEYEEKGFRMSKERAEMWYESLGSFPEKKLRNGIKLYIEQCTFSPQLADIIEKACTPIMESVEEYEKRIMEERKVNV